MNCYYHKYIPAVPACVTLDEQESLHAATSRRQHSGDQVLLIDGEGMRAIGIIESISRSAVKVRISSSLLARRRRPETILASALPKGEGLKTMLSMIAQLGVTTFVPLVCARSVVKADGVNVTRWARLLKEACKQSHNPFFPRIEESISPIEFVRKIRRPDVPILVADQAGGRIWPSSGCSSVGICIGPEGGFTYSEKEEMQAAGAELCTLGGNILRIETAAVAAVSIVRQLSLGLKLGDEPAVN